MFVYMYNFSMIQFLQVFLRYRFFFRQLRNHLAKLLNLLFNAAYTLYAYRNFEPKAKSTLLKYDLRISQRHEVRMGVYWRERRSFTGVGVYSLKPCCAPINKERPQKNLVGSLQGGAEGRRSLQRRAVVYRSLAEPQKMAVMVVVLCHSVGWCNSLFLKK
jgi:hypothetical protein